MAKNKVLNESAGGSHGKSEREGVSEWVGRGTDTSGVEVGLEPRLGTILNFPITVVTGALQLARIWPIIVTFLTHEPHG